MNPAGSVWHRFGWRFLLLMLLLLLPELALLSCPAAAAHQADLVVVLGGGDGARFARGRELVQAGFSSRLVLIEPTVAERQDALATLPFVEIWDDVTPANSWGEAQMTRARMQSRDWRTVLVVSDPPHLLRLQYAWFSSFLGSGLAYTLIASNPPWWHPWRWWQNPQSARFVESEVLKLGYYLLHYRFGL